MRKIENSIKTEYFADGIVYLYPLTNVGEPDEGRKLKRYFGDLQAHYGRYAGTVGIQQADMRSADGSGSIRKDTLRRDIGAAVPCGKRTGDKLGSAACGCSVAFGLGRRYKDINGKEG